MKNIAVIGAGRVGLVSAACFAHLGNRVTCIERNLFYLESLRNGSVPFFEPRLHELVSEATASRALAFSSSIAEGIQGADIIFLAVGTPPQSNGAVDLTDVLQAAKEIGISLNADVCIASKSTVPAGTNDQILSIVESYAKGNFRITLVSNPEFLREGTAVADFLEPDRIVIGVRQTEDADILKELYATLAAPIVLTDICSAELIKAVSNFYLALRISFANQVADLCEASRVDVMKVLETAGMDPRIGRAYLQPGLGFGGPCLPKDVRGLADCARCNGVNAPLIEAVLRVNDQRIDKAVSIVAEALDGLDDRRICVLGLSFKAGTDDIRDAPAIRFIEQIRRAGATVRVHDPIALENFRRSVASLGVVCSNRIDDAVRTADAIAIMTPWTQYRELSLSAMRSVMRGDLLFDGTNMFDPADVLSCGMRYRGMGRPAETADQGAKRTAHASA